jgi:hypothetical protein
LVAYLAEQLQGREVGGGLFVKINGHGQETLSLKKLLNDNLIIALILIIQYPYLNK